MKSEDNNIKKIMDLIDKFKMYLINDDKTNALKVFYELKPLYEKETNKKFENVFPKEKIDELTNFLQEKDEEEINNL